MLKVRGSCATVRSYERPRVDRIPFKEAAMPTDFDELKRQLLQTDEEYRQLATQHHDLDEKLHSLAARNYLSEPEQLEEVTLKKRKLQLKDQMESILRRQRRAAEPMPMTGN
jgi:uncharacterized protein YdcH (DUF465 family)